LIHQLWTEATDAFSKGLNWRVEDQIQSLVSVGTGKLHLTTFSTSLLDIGKVLVDIGKVLVDIATNSDQIADTFHKFHSSLFLESRAFRFNVGQGLENIGWEEESKMPEIQAITRRYI
jgi:hypothetical protein